MADRFKSTTTTKSNGDKVTVVHKEIPNDFFGRYQPDHRITEKANGDRIVEKRSDSWYRDWE